MSPPLEYPLSHNLPPETRLTGDGEPMKTYDASHPSQRHCVEFFFFSFFFFLLFLLFE